MPVDLAGLRLDAALAKMLPDYSRSRLTGWIKEGAVKVNGRAAQPKDKLVGAERIEVAVPQSEEVLAFTPEPMDLDIIYEDDSVMVLNKPAGMVVHPAAGNWSGTLLNGLLAHNPALAQIPRAGIVHRLDKDTSGLMVVAKTLPAQNHLVQQLQARTVKRIYRAVANGVVPFDGKIDTLIGRDPHNRLKMAVVKFGGKEAVTHVKVLERYPAHSYIECALETGRTHQIRVHMQSQACPIAGDERYGDYQANKRLQKIGLKRMFLHAAELHLSHPLTDEPLKLVAPLPQELAQMMAMLENSQSKPTELQTDSLLKKIIH